MVRVSTEPPEVVYSTSSAGFDEPGLDPAVVTKTAPTTNRLSDSTLGTRARDGDVDAFEQLLRQHEAELFRLAFRMLGNREQAQEVVVSTLLEGWRRLPASPRSMTFRIWMTRTAMRNCLKLLAQPTAGAGPTDPTPDEPAVEQAAAAVGHTDLDAALDTLTASERACWVLKELHGMSDTDISHAMAVSEASVPGRVTVARQHLVTALAAA